MTWRVLVVDDEKPARDNLIFLLRAEWADVAIQEASNAAEAQSILQSKWPQIVFLDIEMPGQDGLNWLRLLPKSDRPVTVMVTAHRQYGVDAYDQAALDYLVKPFRRARFRETLQRIQTAMDRAEMGNAAIRMSINAAGQSGWQIRDGARSLWMKPEEVVYLAAEGNYVAVHLEPETVWVRGTLAEFEEALRHLPFLRIHRRFLVGKLWIREVKKQAGRFSVLLRTGQNLPISRHRRQELDILVRGSLD
ncbi:MAG: response regulator transcription factor [Acidobacteria bacterium]|nr:response regulator transcription factor [Acidobacteriota bacterium]MCB9399403.1 response regulator transcription factor [Acidobacteriota bacterium]